MRCRRHQRWPGEIVARNGFVAIFRTPLALALLGTLAAIAPPAARADRSALLTPPGLQTQNPNQPCDRSRKVFTEPRGEFAHGPSGVNYTQDSHCEWLIKARNESQFITLTFHSMGTECSYDYIYVYDGDSFNSTLLGSFSGKTEPQRLVASSGSMLILLYSDTNYVLEGFRASYYVSNCLNNCHNHGKCVGHKCVCHGEWVGPDCEDVACPDGCGERYGRGKCVKGMCKCNKNYSGRLCDLYIDPEGGIWRWLATDAEGMTARAAHTAVYIEEQDSLYVFGGYDLNNVLDSLQVYRFKKSQWEDEWGISLLNRQRYQPQKIDNTLLKAVLANEDKEEASRWGLKSEISLFRNVLYTLAESNLPRKQRSAANITDDEIKEILDDILENVTDSRPGGRYGHAAERIPGGFVIYGGKLKNGSLSSELWMYNITENGGQWILRASNSSFSPPPLARHTLTLAGEYLYVFGGSLTNGEFSSRIFRIQLDRDPNKEQWEEVHPRGGKSLDVRLVAHSTVYYRYTNSLVVYGGIMSSVARFSKLSDRIFCFQLDARHWTEILYPRTPLRDAYIPRERAFHTASIAGNYMIVFGGYTHRHNKEEICYDNQMYLYHLGCHTWINQDVLGPVPGYQYPKRQGVFAHAAAIRMNNTLLITGGYHGNVNADLFGYELPRMFRITDPNLYNPEQSCRYHTTVLACLSDPECGWCSADSSCYGRTIGANCTTNLQTTRCPGICPSLGDCHSCLVHGTTYSAYSRLHSISSKLGLNQCTWCVQNARCHHKDDNYGVCGEDTPSQIPGWWGEKGTEIRTPYQCTELDRRPGLTYIEYHHPINLTMPDLVSLVNATMVDFISPQPTTHTEHAFNGEMMARLVGFVRPPKGLESMDEKLRVCSSYSDTIFRTGLDHSLDTTNIVLNTTTEQASYYFVEWPSLSTRFLVDFQAKRKVGSGIHHQYEHSKMELRHSHHGNWKAFTFEYLEPYSNGACSKYSNCLECLSDSLCGWCDLNNKCLPRTVNETAECSDEIGWKYMTIQPAQCGNCSNYISCEDCISTGMCEWWAEDARCARMGRSTTAVKTTDKCPTPCMQRKSCSDCLDEKGRCVWCEAKAQCFNFAVYTSEYQFGLCREWLDQAVPLSHPHTDENALTHPPKVQQCKSCEQNRNCSTCLRTLSCGWCFDRDNPIDGICMQGDFSRSVYDCAAALNTSAEEAEWAYAQCPDVDECGLGLHNCHKEAKCTNTHGSYNCHCRKGYIGDGFVSCIKTCNETCIHGNCSGSPEYVCKCDLGWTGADCSINCGCNNHSTCETQVGICDECQNWTEGETCDRCRPGSYGNATSGEGCHPCQCNGHGDENLGICDLQTGECFCTDNTGGPNCNKCNPEYYGDPKDGGKCYFQCESRGILTQVGEQGIGSYKSYKNPWGGPEVRECLWLITPHSKNGSGLQDSLIQIDIKKNDINVICGENAVYIYDSLPDLTGNTQQNQLLAVICSPESLSHTIQARTGHLTVHYKQMLEGYGFGFNAVYHVKSCSSGTCTAPHICNEENQCVCPSGFVGSQCETEICPNNCSASFLHGACDKSYGRCVCNDGYGGDDCSIRVKPYQLEVRDLFNTRLLSPASDHFRKTIPRFGHSLYTDKRGSLWMFGGYSLSNGPLNDIRQFDTKNGTWMQVTVDSTAEAKMPRGRYFHAADISFTRQTIYIYGGLTSTGKGQPNVILDDFWEFSIQNQQWDDIEVDLSKPHPPPLAGHSLTVVKRDERETLILIGGVDIENHRELHLWQFDLESKQWQKIFIPMISIGSLYGHTAAYHPQTQIIYIFGGISDYPQNKLYAINVEKMTWTELPVFSDLNRPEELLPRKRYFHSAVTTDNYMIIYGGRSVPYNASDILTAYVYECNQWIRLTEDVSIVGSFPEASYAEAMTIDHDTKQIYVVGGWDGSSQSQVIQISLPEDLCQFWSTGKYSCRHYMGCSFCAVKATEDSSSHCYTSGRSEVCDSLNGTLIFNNGIQCDDTWMMQRNCSLFDSCTSCMASWPTHYEERSPCKWCSNCDSKSVCVSSSVECPASEEKQCDKEMVTTEQCPMPSCELLSCEDCLANKNCVWTSSSLSPHQHVTTCVSKESVDTNDATILTSCPDPCHTYQNCTSCLNDDTVNDNPKYCRWSTALNACISPNYYPLYCAGGTCGLVLDFDELDQCPEPCHAYTQCSSCLRHAHCGWCSRDGGNGDGVCTEGSLESFSEYPASSTCDLIYASRKNITELDPADTFTWNYVHCPQENECENGHHNCDPKAEMCLDDVKGYKCICGEGYKAKGDDCVPICKQGCVRGTCIEPNVCECDFGYVGANCSIQCQCNGHSNCLGPDKLDECIQCHNNTMGAQCDKCKPLFVGNPKNNGQCIPCLQYCNGHSDICVAQDAEPPVKNMTRSELEGFLTEGPISDAICLRCANKTDGNQCEGCILGNFRGSDNLQDPCRPCECHGHGDVCDPVSGEKCNCGNNTESDPTCSASSSKNSAQLCWKVQCSKCRESYMGNPVDGHQCYKQITVESRMCFDAKPIEECKVKPQPLRPGQTVFFVIQPRFMNVDIRVIIDVTQGELDVFMSPQDDSFIVHTNQSNGHHMLLLDNRYRWVTEIDSELFSESVDLAPFKHDSDNTSLDNNAEKLYWTPQIHDCQSLGGTGFFVKDQRARDLSTYITLNQCNTLIRLFGLRNRLVLTLPQNAHNLSATRFYIALRASTSSDHSYGSIVFRQDQLHIDLFVFFSVFFSCFFLFLAICVVAWKAKQAADFRRDLRLRVVEMQHMANRPFARIRVVLAPETETPVQTRRRGRASKSASLGNGSEIRPVAIEPTADNIAAVGTVFVSLPGKYKAPVTLALGSSLVVLSRQYPAGVRPFLRRRGSHHAVHPPNNV